MSNIELTNEELEDLTPVELSDLNPEELKQVAMILAKVKEDHKNKYNGERSTVRIHPRIPISQIECIEYLRNEIKKECDVNLTNTLFCKLAIEFYLNFLVQDPQLLVEMLKEWRII